MSKHKQKKAEEFPQPEGYKMEKRTIGMLKANLWAMGVMLAALIVGIPLILWLHGGFEQMRFLGIILVLLLVVSIVVHELIHGFTWMALTHSSFKHLSFGLLPGGVYCHIDVPMKKRAYVTGALMPLLLLGVVPYVVSLIAGWGLLMVFASIMIGAAMGDVLIVWAIRKDGPDTLVYDHPSEPGCLVYLPWQDTAEPE